MTDVSSMAELENRELPAEPMPRTAPLWKVTCKLGPKGRKELVIPRWGKGQYKEDERAARGRGWHV